MFLNECVKFYLRILMAVIVTMIGCSEGYSSTEQKTGWIDIKSVPSGAKVYIVEKGNPVYFGQTPLIGQTVELGLKIFSVELLPFSPYTCGRNIKPGSNREVSVEFETSSHSASRYSMSSQSQKPPAMTTRKNYSEDSRVVIRTDPLDAEVALYPCSGGKKVLYAEPSTVLNPDKWLAVISKKGYYTREFILTMEKGVTVDVNAHLMKEFNFEARFDAVLSTQEIQEVQVFFARKETFTLRELEEVAGKAESGNFNQYAPLKKLSYSLYLMHYEMLSRMLKEYLPPDQVTTLIYEQYVRSKKLYEDLIRK